MAKLVRLFALVAVVALMGAACGNSNDKGSSSEEKEGGSITLPGGDTAEDHGTQDVSGDDEAQVELDDFYFEPTVITGDPGSKVKLELENEGDNAHNFSLDDQGIDQDVEAGEDADVTVTIPMSGAVEFYCKFHRSNGMAGELKAA